MTPLIAHASHWLVNVAYFIPVLGFVAWLGVTQWRERRRRPERQQATGARGDRHSSDSRS